MHFLLFRITSCRLCWRFGSGSCCYIDSRNAKFSKFAVGPFVTLAMRMTLTSSVGVVLQLVGVDWE